MFGHYNNANIYEDDFQSEAQSSLNAKIPFVTICLIQYTELHKNFCEVCIISLHCFVEAKFSKVATTKYYKKNAVKMTETKSTRYSKQSLAGREILDGLASPTPKLPPVPKAKRRKKQKPMQKC